MFMGSSMTHDAQSGVVLVLRHTSAAATAAAAAAAANAAQCRTVSHSATQCYTMQFKSCALHTRSHSSTDLCVLLPLLPAVCTQTGTAGSQNASGQQQLMCSWHSLDGWRPAPGRLSDFVELSFDVSVTAQLIEVWEGALSDTLQPPPSLQPPAPPMILQEASGLTRVEAGDGAGSWVAYQLAPAPAAIDRGDGGQGGGFGQGCIKTLARPPTAGANLTGVAGAQVKLVRLYIAPPTPTTAVVVQGVRLTGRYDPAPPPQPPGGGSSSPSQNHSPPPLSPAHPPPRPLPPMVPSVAVGAGVLNGGRGGGRGGGSRSTSRLLPAVIVPSTVALVIALAAAAYWARQRKRNKGGASTLMGWGFGGRPQRGSPLLAGAQVSSNQGSSPRFSNGGDGGGASASLHHHWPGVVGGQGGVGAHGSATHPHTSSHQRRQNALQPSPYAADEPLLLIPSQDLLRGAEGHNRGASIVRRTSGVEGSTNSQSSSTLSVAGASGSILLPLPPMP